MVDGIFFPSFHCKRGTNVFLINAHDLQVRKKKGISPTLPTKKIIEERNKLCTSASVFDDEYVYV
jgi:hypothetical protein